MTGEGSPPAHRRRAALREFRRAVPLWLACACAVVSSGCNYEPEATAKAGRPSTASVRREKREGGRQSVLVATSRAADGVFFTRPPLDLHGAWRAEITTGFFDPRRAADAGEALFGLEVDRRETTPQPSEFYGVYCRRFAEPEGIQVFASSHGGNHGQIFLSGETLVDLAVDSNGSTVTFLARAHGSGGAYQTVGSRALSTPSAPHQAGFGFFGAPKGGTYGFTQFRTPENGNPATAVGPEQRAIERMYLAATGVLEASYAVDGPVVADDELTDAVAKLGKALVVLAQAISDVDALPEPVGKASARTRALRELRASERKLEQAKAALEKKGRRAIRPFLAAAAKQLHRSALKVTDLLLPQDLRDALPGKGI